MGIPVYANFVAPLAVSAEMVLVAALAIVLALVAAMIGVWRVVGKGPRRSRAYARARELLAKGDWQGAKLAVQEIRESGIPSPEWAGRVNNLEGEVQRGAGDAALAAGKYEEALEFYAAAAKLLGLNRDEASAKVVDGMLGELRRLFGRKEDDKAVAQARRILDIRPACTEALFWLGLVYIRQNRNEQAIQALRAAHESKERKGVEPTLYLGMLLLREGQHKDGLKYLSEASRTAGNSIVVTWQLGMGLAQGGGDPAFAIRALQKSLAPDGLPSLVKDPDSLWQQSFPDDSYIAKAAATQRFICPILGGSVPVMVRQAKLALGQTLYRAERFPEAAGVFQDLANESEPTPTLLRSLGIALCRLERYDEAYQHLKAAWEEDASKDPLTACYLAHAAAIAKPSRPEDKPANVRWAVRLLRDLAYPVDVEPTKLVGAVYAEASAADVPVPVEDHLRLCNTMVALNMTDAIAARAIDHFARANPDAVRPQFAFLYGWSAKLHDFKGERDLDLLGKLFQNQTAAESFYRERGWDLPAVERLYLERWSQERSGFPDVFGPDYPAKCEQAMLDRARELEGSGRIDEAKAIIDLLQRLIPPNAASLDRLAKLTWHRGDVSEAVRLLMKWAEQTPDDPKPRLRLAMLEQERGNPERAAELVRAGYEKSAGLAKADAAFLGAKIALKSGCDREALEWVDACLSHQPDHAEAQLLRTALRWESGERDQLAGHAEALARSIGVDPRRQYLLGVCKLMGGDLDAARESVRLLLTQPNWQADAQYLIGAIEMRREDWNAAASQLSAAVQTGTDSTSQHSKALLGRVRINQGDYLAAVGAWLQLPEEKRKAWGISEVLPGWAYLAGVQALRAGDDLVACEWFGRAREMDWKEPRLTVLQERAAIAAVRRLLSRGDLAKVEPFKPTLDRASGSRGSLQMPAALLLARFHRWKGDLVEARDVLRRLGPPSSGVMMELGMVALQDQRLTEADDVFDRLLRDEPGNSAARANLFWARLSQGQIQAAQDLLPDIIRDAAPVQLRLLTHLQILMKSGPAASALLADITNEEEQQLLAALFAIGRLEVVVPWLCVLAAARPHSPSAREAQTIGMIRLGKQLFDRGDWLGCEKWLGPLAKARPLASVRNLLGCCLCLQHDFASGILHFQEALRLAGDDPRLHQNLALAFTWQGDHGEADLCWGRYLGTSDRRLPRPPGFIEYHERLRFHVLRHLGNQAYEREQWNSAMAYLSEAQKLEPDNTDLTERLFLLQVQAGERIQARRTLSHLQLLKPKHGPFELYELDLIEVRNGADLERLLDALAMVVERLVGDLTSQDKAVTRVLPQFQARADQLTRTLREIRDDLQRLPEESEGWYDSLRDIRGVRKDLRRLRQIIRYAAALQVSEPNRRRLNAMNADLDRKIDYCRKWEEMD
jgi:tetratricopeptide (TPR) repeat protein